MTITCKDCNSGTVYLGPISDIPTKCPKCGSVNIEIYNVPGQMKVVDNVNHPTHYQTSSGLETFEVIKAFTEDLKGIEAVYTGNVLKYMCRWNKKNGLEDLEKAEWYLKHLIEEVKNRKEKGE